MALRADTCRGVSNGRQQVNPKLDYISVFLSCVTTLKFQTSKCVSISELVFFPSLSPFTFHTASSLGKCMAIERSDHLYEFVSRVRHQTFFELPRFQADLTINLYFKQWHNCQEIAALRVWLLQSSSSSLISNYNICFMRFIISEVLVD